MFQSISRALHSGLCFFQHPKPALPSIYFTVNLPVTGAIQGFHVPHNKVCQVRCLLSTERRIDHESPKDRGLYLPLVPFGASVLTTSACFRLRSLSQIQISSPYQLSSIYPICGYQEGVALTIDIPQLITASLHCQASSLFMALDSFDDTNGSLFKVENNFIVQLHVARPLADYVIDL